MVFLPDTNLYFLRHGLAGQHGDPKYKDDSLRPLTAEGKKKMHRASLGMKSLGLKFDAVLSSPYVRARQTAEVVVQVYRIKKIHFTENLLPPASIKSLLQEIHTHFPKSKNVLVVGHEPHLTGMISCLLKSNKPLAIDLKKGALCCVNLNAATKEPNLMWLLTSTQLGSIKE